MSLIEDDAARSAFYVEADGESLWCGTDEAGSCLGQMHCFWETKPFLEIIRQLFHQIFTEAVEDMRRLTGEYDVSDSSIEDEAHHAVEKAESLLTQWAPQLFFKAQCDLVLMVLKQVIQENAVAQAIDENGQPFILPLYDEDVEKFLLDLRQEVQKLANESVGIRKGARRKDERVIFEEAAALREKVLESMIRIIEKGQDVTQQAVSVELSIGNGLPGDRTFANKLRRKGLNWDDLKKIAEERTSKSQ